MTQRKPDDDFLTDDDIQTRLYEIASDARLGIRSVRGMIEAAVEIDDDDMLAIDRLFERIERRLLDIAGGHAFTKKQNERVKAVAS